MVPPFPQIRVATRGLARAPGFALTAVATLTLGIGLSTAVFTIAEAILIRRLAVADQDRLVVLWAAGVGQNASFPLGIDDAREMSRRSGAL
jgi:putative ABC transport system permease protein